ncbi:MAG TPA: hypothetical protein VNN09_06430 [Candidatus Competibacteraceae bacterium]|nr:hypothetical protein [Candidatus Competibacteraceae bacterium]
MEQLDLSGLSVEELNELIARAKKLLDLREFEEGLRQAVQQYQSRDPRVIRI